MSALSPQPRHQAGTASEAREAVIQIRTLARHRWILAALAAVVVAAAAVAVLAFRGSPDRVSVEFVLGGGTAGTGTGPRREVAGKLQTMTTDERGNVALFTRDRQGFELWTAGPGRAVERVRVPALDRVDAVSGNAALQAAAAPDGGFYLALEEAGLWKVTRDGRASEIVKPSGRPTGVSSHVVADEVPVRRFSAYQVLGVGVGGDGTVFFSDLQDDRNSVLIHRLQSGRVTRIAGRPLRPGRQVPKEDPNLLAPETGGPAESTYISESSIVTPLAWNNGSLYVHTGHGILTIATATERIFPVVAGRNTASLKRPDSPFKPFGKAIDGHVEGAAVDDGDHEASIAVDRATGDLYYGAGRPLPGNDTTEISTRFRWGGDLTASQRDFRGSLRSAQQTIYQVDRDGDLSVVTAGAKALSVGNGYLYIAVDSCPSSAGKCDATNYRSAVVRLRLPAART
ncbi:hypothetical protein [Actinomadura sp. NTSP31]|uniref:hypothetical protein n=1 Tax=Actinomadura sp. NTSP31 TaxID=1735447 RepID=UPI0035BF6C09